MKLPPGFQANGPNQVCKLTRSFYGFKQASRQWNEKLTNALSRTCFIQTKYDPSLFTKVETGTFIAILVYVDDLVITGNNIVVIQHLKQYLDEFKIKNLGDLKYFLGIEACRSKNGLNICQRKYTMDILKEAGFLDCKLAATPIAAGQKLVHDDTNLLPDPRSYRRLVGRLIYLTATRPDIAFTVQQLSQFIDAPTNKHVVAAHRVLR